MRVLGIDPGIATTGFAVVSRDGGRLAAHGFGAISTPAGLPQAARLAKLRSAIEELISEHHPDTAAIERLFFSSNVKTAMAVGQASGVALACAGAAGIEVFDYTPLEVKQSVAGTGSAPKKQVQAMVAALLNLEHPPSPPDAADACALAICHLNRSGLARAIGRSEKEKRKVAG